MRSRSGPSLASRPRGRHERSVLFSLRKRVLKVPQPRSGVAIGVATVWAIGLLAVDCGAQIEALDSVPVVARLEACDLHRVPSAAEIVTTLAPGDEVVVRSTIRNEGPSVCFEVELADGRHGYVPWDQQYLRDAGVHVGFR